ncbi:tetratricopeptide repeat protein [Candidatus Parcubacteria bacterium]|nr:tetratricopeptide repeat protein [Candidatus Parcubacteria bacterium]
MEKKNKLFTSENVSLGLILLGFFLTPLFFLSFPIPLVVAKSILLAIVTLVSVVFWIIQRFKDGKFTLPYPLLSLAAAVLVVIYFLSSFFSSPISGSVIGQGFEIETASFILMMVILMLVVPNVVRTKNKIFYSYLAFFASFFIVALFFALRMLFGTSVLNLGVFPAITSNMVGSWNDTGIFMGLAAIISLITIESLSLSRLYKILTYVALVVSLFFLVLINFSIIWYILGLFSLIFFVYLISFGGGSVFSKEGRTDGVTVPVASLIVLLISVIFVLPGSHISNSLSNKFGVSEINARPSWGTTFNIMKQTLSHHPILGVGPNRFLNQWVLNKPLEINNSVFWNVDFNYAIGLIPTSVITTGVLGLLAWIAFLGLLIYAGFKALMSKISDKISRYLIVSSFLATLYLWIMCIFYVPGTTMVALTFLFTGLFIATLYNEKLITGKTISFVESPRAGFVSVLFLIALLISTIVWGFVLSQKLVSLTYFQKSIAALNVSGNISEAENYAVKAANASASDASYRLLTELNLIRLNDVINQKNVSTDTLRNEIKSALGTAIENAGTAKNIDPGNYQNWLELGKVYESVVPLGVQGAYENAKLAYTQAATLNPTSPAVSLTLARLEINHNDLKKAREYITKSLQQKNNYTDAIFLLSQLEVTEGNVKAALNSIEAASLLAPNDPVVYFQLGLLRYNDKNYAGAAEALQHAVEVSPQYSNAKYFYGLSLDKLGRSPEAIQQFNDIATLNPDNSEVKLILANLHAGRSPFSNAKPPIDSTPEKRKKLPIEDKTTVDTP